MSSPPSGEAPDVVVRSDDWARAALQNTVAESARFARTFAAFALRPRRAAATWYRDARAYMNPLGFVASAAGLYWAIVSLLEIRWPIPGDGTETVFDNLTSAVGPQVHYGLLGLAMHAALRLLGSRRTTLGALGVSFFAGGSAGMTAALAMTGIARYVGHQRGTSSIMLDATDALPAILLVIAVLAYSTVCFVMARAMMGLHGAPPWKAALAGAIAILATSFLFGTIFTEGTWGWHPYLALTFDGGFHFSFGFRG